MDKEKVERSAVLQTVDHGGLKGSRSGGGEKGFEF